MTNTQLVSDRPGVGAPKPWSFPPFDRRDVAGGQVLAAHIPGRPLAVVSLVVDAGAVTEPEGKGGVGLLTARALSEGTGGLDAYGFAVAAERLGASWDASVDWDSLRCGFEVPAAGIGPAAQLLADAVRRPTLDEEALRRVHAERVDEARVDRSQPAPRAAMTFAGAAFRRSSRYATPAAGDVATLTGVTTSDIREFHASRFGPDTATLVLAGDLSGIDVDDLAAAVFDGWKPTGAAAGTAVPEPIGGVRRILLVDRPGSVQSVLYAGHDGPRRKIPDYVPMTTMSMGLGGMFNSRLMTRMREEKGYTYGAFGTFDCRRDGGIFAARAAVATDVTAPALETLVAEIESVHQDGLTADEVQHAVNYRAGVFPVSFAGVPQVANGIAEIVVHGHPDDHFNRLRAEILAVEKEAVDAAAAAHLRPDELICVVVGDAGVVGDSLRATGLGPVEVVADVD